MSKADFADLVTIKTSCGTTRYRKITHSFKTGKKLKTPLFQVSQSPFLYLTEKEIKDGCKRTNILFTKQQQHM